MLYINGAFFYFEKFHFICIVQIYVCELYADRVLWKTRDKVEDNCKTTHESSPCQPRAGHSEMQAKEADDVRYYYFLNLFLCIYKNYIKYINNVCLNLTMKSAGFCEQV